MRCNLAHGIGRNLGGAPQGVGEIFFVGYFLHSCKFSPVQAAAGATDSARGADEVEQANTNKK